MIRQLIRLTILVPFLLFAEEKKDPVFIDGFAAIVGDHIILKSDVAQLVNMTAAQRHLNPSLDMDKLLALQKEIVLSLVDQKIMLEMAALDSIEVDEKEVNASLDQQINTFVDQAGSEKKAEEVLGQSIKSFRREFWYDMKDRLVTERYQQTLINKITVNRNDVEAFFSSFQDSLPVFPTMVKLYNLLLPVKAGEKSRESSRKKLSDIRDRIVSGLENFSDLASLYSQDPGSKQNGGSLGFVRRGSLVPEFESVAFTQEIGTISDIIETQFGYHIIETEEKRGDKIRVRHILIIPEITEEDESMSYRFAISLKDSISSLNDFKRLVKIHSSDSQTKDIGGSLGWINPQRSPIPEISQVIGLLEIGECSLPVRTEQGYHLFWIESVRQGGKPNLKIHWTEIENMALNQKRMKWYDNWITDAREKFYIQINSW